MNINNIICTAITKNGKGCSRISRCNGFCLMHYNKQNKIVNNDNKQNNVINDKKISKNRWIKVDDNNDKLKIQLNQNPREIEKNNNKNVDNTIYYSDNKADIYKKLKLVQNNLLLSDNENKSLTNIKIYSENKIEELNKKISELTENNKKLENTIIELDNDLENKIKIRANLLKDEYKNYIIDYDKYNNINNLYNKIKNSMNLITNTTIGDKIKVIKFNKNGIIIIIKYFIGTEHNIDEFTKKFDLDLNNLFDSFNDNYINYKNEWIENIITNLNNYTVNFNNYFTSNIDNTQIKINWIKNNNKFILQIYPDMDIVQLIIKTIIDYKNTSTLN